MAFYRLGAFFARWLPERLAKGIARFLLFCQYPFRVRSRRNVRRNLDIVLPDAPREQRRRVAREVFVNFARSIYFFLRARFLSPEELRRRSDYDGLREVLDRLEGGRGCILVSPHMGPWEVGGACLAAMGLRLHTVAWPHPSPRVTRFFEEQRRRVGIQSIGAGDPVRVLVRALDRGEHVALLVDRPYDSRSEPFRWFGREVVLPIGHLALAVRCRVPVVTCVCVFEGDDRFKFHFGGPHMPDESLTPDAAMRDLQERCLADFRELIRAHPAQWFHFDAL